MLQICAVYFTTIYWMARHISADSAPDAGSGAAAADAQSGIQVLAAAHEHPSDETPTATFNQRFALAHPPS